MSDIIGLATFIENRALGAPQALGTRQLQSHTAFTPRDQEDLDGWSNGDRRVSVCASDMGPFAMLYQAGRPWASWGVVRQGRSVVLWDCVTLADIGRFPSMIDALAAVPIDEFPAPVANIIQFAAASARAAAIR